jgi:hypothetical protein
MGNKLFGVDIAKLIKQHVAPGLLDATLHSKSQGSRTPGDLLAGPTVTTTPYVCKGFIDTQKVRFSDGTVVRAGSKVVVLIGDTINNGDTAPQPGDEITIEGTKYIIPEDGKIDRDPAAAQYECEVRP